MVAREAIIRFLRDKGVEFLFHLPGIHTLSLNDALSRSNIRVIVGRHESNSGFMADGFSRATGTAGFLLVTPGPGIGNCVSVCMEAYGDDIPLFILFVDVGTKEIERGALHGFAATESIFSRIAKATFRIDTEKELLPTLERAYMLANAPRRGPVVVSVLYDLLDRKLPEDVGERQSGHGEEQDGQERHFEGLQLRRVLEGKERPVIIAGKALMESGVGRSVEDLCGRSHIPLLTTGGAKGIIPEDHAWAFGDMTSKGVARTILAASDAILAIGTRLRKSDSTGRGVRLHDLTHIDIDERWLGRNYRTDLALCGGMEEAIEAIHLTARDRQYAWDIERLKDYREQELAELERSCAGFRIVRALRQVVPRDTMTIWDLTILGYWAELWFPVFRERSFFSPRGASPTFYGLPAAIGAKLGQPSRPCLCVTGDGSFLPVVAELAAVAATGLPVVTLVYNNGSYGVLEDSMRRRHGTTDSMNLENPDFVKLANSFGVRAKRTETPEGLERIFRKEVTWDMPFVVEFRFPPLSPPW